MRNYVNQSARANFRIANIANLLAVTLCTAAVVSSGKTQLALTIGTVTMCLYADCASNYAREFNDKVNAEFTPEFREQVEKMNNNKLFIW